MRRKLLRTLALGAAAVVLFFALTEPADAARRWHRVGQDLAGALAEGDAPGATTFPWERCRWRELFRIERMRHLHVSHEIVVVCPGGVREYM